ncbi:MAG: hypothetical protein LBK99_02830 [Opitutaceae bacterium]|jgi:autotransporter-associated beta strand protein|nr:hypothetical protein [Opitutaceae bacterium]
MENKIINRSLALLAASAALCGNVVHAQRSLTTANPITENFSDYLGTPATVPSDFIVESDQGIPAPQIQYKGIGDGSGATVDSGFWAYTNSGGTAFGILEGDQGGGDLGDSRLFLYFRNDTGSDLTRLRVRYKVQIWRDGPRQNSIRLKYNTSTGGFSNLPDLADTPAKVNVGDNGAYDGNNPDYYTQVDVEFALPAALPDGAGAYLRWQYSTASGSGRRDGLGITDIEVSAVAAGTPQAWQDGAGGPGFWNTTANVWSDEEPWSNSANYSAVFGGDSGTVTLTTDITAVDLVFNADGYLVQPDSNQTLTLKGSVTVDAGYTATLSVPVAGTSGLLKLGEGVLKLGGANTYSGTTSINVGTIQALADDVLPATGTVQIGDDAVLDLNGHDLTIGGLQGDANGNVIVTSGNTLTLDTAGNFSYKGDISGAGDVVKTGVARQRFRNQIKAYTGDTFVLGGTLEITENGIPTGTSGLSIDGAGTEVLLTTDDINGSTYEFGSAATTVVSIDNDAHLASDTDKAITVENDIVIGSGGGRIYARGTGESASLTLNGTLSGTGSLRRQGQAKLVINGDASGVTGAVNLRNGLTVISSGVTLGSGSITVTIQGDNSSERASLTGAGTIDGSVVYAANSAINVSAATAPGTLTINGNLGGLGNATITNDGSAATVFRVLGTVSPATAPTGLAYDTTSEPGVTLVIVN